MGGCVQARDQCPEACAGARPWADGRFGPQPRHGAAHCPRARRSESGQVEPVHYVAIQDVGWAFNPAAVEAQMHGGAVRRRSSPARRHGPTRSGTPAARMIDLPMTPERVWRAMHPADQAGSLINEVDAVSK
ncbi:MAG: molybdopterin-dependent oxidoreductase [Chloroflexi bacterium]|nr:molybdopterin-dependent oxidoreductase [Chloroflexota bacterium]